MMNISGQVVPGGNTLLRLMGPTLSREARWRLQWMDFYGRHLPGVAWPLRPWLEPGDSLLILGAPGTGKTTLLRDATHIIATVLRRRVVVDTSNEIGGGGNVPHPAIGTARRIQVPDRAEQDRLLLEAVQNHTPEVIVIDEIGTRQEAEAAATIAERGVQMLATAHGRTLANLVRNTALNLLLGGVGTVPLTDSMALLRGVVGAAAGRHTVQERLQPPPFTVVAELLHDDLRTIVLCPDAAQAVDALLDGERTEAVCLSARLTPEFIRQSLAAQQAEAECADTLEAAPAPDANPHTDLDTGGGEADTAGVQDRSLSRLTAESDAARPHGQWAKVRRIGQCAGPPARRARLLATWTDGAFMRTSTSSS